MSKVLKKRPKKPQSKKKKKYRILLIEQVLLLVLSVIAAFVIIKDYKERPGIMESEHLVATERGADHITFEWEETRNTDCYALFFKKFGSEYADWTKIEIASETENVNEREEEGTRKLSYTFNDLEEGTKYVAVIRADNDERNGFETDGKVFSTRKRQTVKTRDHISKLTTNKSFNIKAEAETPLQFKSSNTSVATVSETGKIKIKNAGKTNITVTATENNDYVEDSKTVKMTVYEAHPVKAGGATAYLLGELNMNNCKVVKRVTGQGSIHVPQGVAYTGDKYIIAYGMSNAQRVISFGVDNDEKDVSVPGTSLGHPNGFTYCDKTGLCYCVKGYTSRCVTYSPKTGAYGVTNLPMSCSGIAYDKAKEQFYLISKTGYGVYDSKFKYIRSVGVVKHNAYTYTQDGGGHAGIMMRCLSSKSKHGTNYVDLYDMTNGTYLGSFACNLSEVESAVVDEDGYMLLLCNNSSTTDYIWKTPVNIEDIAEGM